MGLQVIMVRLVIRPQGAFTVVLGRNPLFGT